MCTKILAYMAYMGKYQKEYIKRHTFYLVITLTIFPKLVFIYIERKIANSTNTNTEILFLKNLHVNTKNMFQELYWKCKALLFILF